MTALAKDPPPVGGLDEAGTTSEARPYPRVILPLTLSPAEAPQSRHSSAPTPAPFTDSQGAFRAKRDGAFAPASNRTASFSLAAARAALTDVALRAGITVTP